MIRLQLGVLSAVLGLLLLVAAEGALVLAVGVLLLVCACATVVREFRQRKRH